LIFLMFDKYGEEGLNKYYEPLYALVYRERLLNKQVKYAAVAKYPNKDKLFFLIEKSKNYLELQELVRKAKEKINCRMDVPAIIQFFRDYDVELETSEKNINLDNYKKSIDNGND